MYLLLNNHSIIRFLCNNLAEKGGISNKNGTNVHFLPKNFGSSKFSS